jgi:hypothetical protein
VARAHHHRRRRRAHHAVEAKIRVAAVVIIVHVARIVVRVADDPAEEGAVLPQGRRQGLRLVRHRGRVQVPPSGHVEGRELVDPVAARG